MRPISNVVDVTNYVMLALGSPLHAFDLDALRGGRVIVVAAPARARSCARSTARCASSTGATCVIADAERAVALAGIMGGEETEVAERDDLGAARGGELRAGRDPRELRAARAAHRGLEPLGEGRRPAPRRARPRRSRPS